MYLHTYKFPQSQIKNNDMIGMLFNQVHLCSPEKYSVKIAVTHTSQLK